MSQTPDPAATHGDAGLQLLVLLRRIARSLDLHSRFLARRTGLTSPQLLVLRELHRIGPALAGRLADSVGLSQATLTGILDRLERKGLAERRRDKQDKRRVWVRITRTGLSLVRSPPPLLQESFLQQFNCLTKAEQNSLLTSLQRVVRMLDSAAVFADPPATRESTEAI